MTNTTIRRTLFAAGITASLGIALVGCDNNADQSSRQAGATEEITDAADAAAQAVSDTWITTKVKSLLLADSEAKGLEISVDTKDGVVTLEGEVTSQATIDHIEALAREVEGVKRVNFSALTVARR